MPRGRKKNPETIQKELKVVLNPLQQDSIRGVNEVMTRMLFTFSEFEEVSYHDIRMLANEASRFRVLFHGVLDND